MPDENVAAPQPSPASTTPQTKKPINWKLIGIIAVVAAILIGGAGYAAVVLDVFGTEEEPVQTTTTTTKTATPSANTTKETPKDEMADWKTYEVKESKFSLKLPPDWYAPEGGGEGPPVYTIKSKPSNYRRQQLEIEPILGSTVEVQKNSYLGLSWRNKEVGEVIIDGVKGWKVSGMLTDDQGEYYQESIVVQKGDTAFTFDWADSLDKSETDTYQKILSTFKFLD